MLFKRLEGLPDSEREATMLEAMLVVEQRRSCRPWTPGKTEFSCELNEHLMKESNQPQSKV